MSDLRELLQQRPGAAQESRSTILRAIMSRSSNQKDLVRRSGLSQATVSNVVAELASNGIVRKGSVVTMEPTTGVAVGVELGFHRTAVVARRVDQDHERVATRSARVGSVDGVDRWPGAVVRLVHELVTEVGDGSDDLATVGLGIPRAVDPRDQRLTPPLLPPWGDVPDPAKILTERLRDEAPRRGNPLSAQLHVLVDNDATLGALAESTYAHPDQETILYIKASTGIGAGIVISGRVIRGRRGVAGEIGHIVVERDGRFCLCGGRGCLETVVGARSLLTQARAALGDRTLDSVDDLIARARAGNPVCRRVLHEGAHRLGLTVGSVCNLLNPDVVVLGGTLGHGADIVLDPCRAGIAETAMAAAIDPYSFSLVSSSVREATAQGALLLGIQGTSYRF